MPARIVDAWALRVENGHLDRNRWAFGMDAAWHLWLRMRRLPCLVKRRPIQRVCAAGKFPIVAIVPVRGVIWPRRSPRPLSRLAAVAAQRDRKTKRRAR
jgi:hypothetical protein